MFVAETVKMAMRRLHATSLRDSEKKKIAKLNSTAINGFVDKSFYGNE